MAWPTLSNIAAAGAVVTRASLQQLVDALKELGDPWEAYTPTWTASPTTPVLGNGGLSGFWISAGKLVHYRIELRIGSTTTVGSGIYFFSLPVAAKAPAGGASPIGPLGEAVLWDVSASARFTRVAATGNSFRDSVILIDPSGVAQTNATPFVPANGDLVVVQGTYEAA